MKLYLHGPREGQTIKMRDIQFTNGIAEHTHLPKILERYYGVKDFPPDSFDKIKQPKGQEITFGVKELDQEELAKSIKEHADDVQENNLSINNEHEGEMNDGLQDEERREEKEVAQKELRDLIEAQKQELSKPRIKKMSDFSNNFPKYKAYVKELTGLSPRGKKQAKELLAQYASEQNIEFEGI